MKKVCIVLGTRPEIIKLAPVIGECKKRKINFFVIHTNQHYSRVMDGVFFNDLGLSKPKYNLNVGSGRHGETTGKMLAGIEEILVKERPDVVLVQGDTNSVLAGALAASKLGMKVGHVEAGLRSGDRSMPEEINRIIVDHISDYLFPPTAEAVNNLYNEGIEKKKIYKVGNTVVDAVFQNLDIAGKKGNILKRLKITGAKYAVATVHRPANADNARNLKSIFEGIAGVLKLGIEKIIFPAHPRVEKQIKEFGIKLPANVIQIEPVGYLDMLFLIKNSSIICSDSGGIQEEACILGVPCVTLRDNTERPETVRVGSSILAGADKQKIIVAAKKFLGGKRKWKNPFGDGTASRRIVDVIEKGEK